MAGRAGRQKVRVLLGQRHQVQRRQLVLGGGFQAADEDVGQGSPRGLALFGEQLAHLAQQGERRAPGTGLGAQFRHAQPRGNLHTVAAPGIDQPLQRIRRLDRGEITGRQAQFDGLACRLSASAPVATAGHAVIDGQRARGIAGLFGRHGTGEIEAGLIR